MVVHATSRAPIAEVAERVSGCRAGWHLTPNEFKRNHALEPSTARGVTTQSTRDVVEDYNDKHDVAAAPMLLRTPTGVAMG